MWSAAVTDRAWVCMYEISESNYVCIEADETRRRDKDEKGAAHGDEISER